MMLVEFIYTRYSDPGTRGWVCQNDVTHQERGIVTPQRLQALPGHMGEHELFRRSPTGRMNDRKWNAFVQSVRKNGVTEPITLWVSEQGFASVFEGNHRIRAAMAAKALVPLEISYFCNSQRRVLLFHDVPRIVLPALVTTYVGLLWAAKLARGQSKRAKSLKAAEYLLSMPKDLRELAISVVRTELVN
jgi:hypothetical protein